MPDGREGGYTSDARQRRAVLHAVANGSALPHDSMRGRRGVGRASGGPEATVNGLGKRGVGRQGTASVQVPLCCAGGMPSTRRPCCGTHGAVGL